MGKRITKRWETELPANVQAVWEFHSSVEALKQLSPPDRHVEVLGTNFAVAEGEIHKIKSSQFGIPLLWEAKITKATPPTGFEDLQIKGPFKYWHHKHIFQPKGDHTLLIDELEYEPPFGILGTIANTLFIDRDLENMFAYRHKRTLEHFSK